MSVRRNSNTGEDLERTRNLAYPYKQHRDLHRAMNDVREDPARLEDYLGIVDWILTNKDYEAFHKYIDQPYFKYVETAFEYDYIKKILRQMRDEGLIDFIMWGDPGYEHQGGAQRMAKGKGMAKLKKGPRGGTYRLTKKGKKVYARSGG